MEAAVRPGQQQGDGQQQQAGQHRPGAALPEEDAQLERQQPGAVEERGRGQPALGKVGDHQRGRRQGSRHADDQLEPVRDHARTVKQQEAHRRKRQRRGRAQASEHDHRRQQRKHERVGRRSDQRELMEVGQHQRPGRELGGAGGGEGIAHDRRQEGQAAGDGVGQGRYTEGAGEGELEADVVSQRRSQAQHQGCGQGHRDVDLGVAPEDAGRYHQSTHGGGPQGRGRGPGHESVEAHHSQRDQRSSGSPDPAHRPLDEARQEGNLEPRDHDDMDEPAGDHRLFEGGRQGGTVTEDHTQDQRRLGLGQDAVDPLHEGMTDGEDPGVRRIDAAGQAVHEARAFDDSGDALVGQEGSVVELLEAAGPADLAGEQNPATRLDGGCAAQARDQAQPHRPGAAAQADAVDGNRYPQAAAPADRVVVDPALEGGPLPRDPRRKADRGTERTPGGAEEEAGQEEEHQQPAPTAA